MSKIHFSVNVATWNCVTIDVTNDVLLVWWMKVYPFCFNQSKPLSQAEIKWSESRVSKLFCSNLMQLMYLYEWVHYSEYLINLRKACTHSEWWNVGMNEMHIVIEMKSDIFVHVEWKRHFLVLVTSKLLSLARKVIDYSTVSLLFSRKFSFVMWCE